MMILLARDPYRHSGIQNNVSTLRVGASRPKAVAMANGQTTAKLPLTLPPGIIDWLPEYR
jgi:hypothetical protein